MALSEGWAPNYEVVKSAILDRVGLFLERYRQNFWLARWMGGLRPQRFAQSLVDWATCWLRPATHMVEEIMDAVVLEQFLQGIPEKVRF